MNSAAEDASFVIVRKLKTTPRAIWRALTEPQALMRWFAPSDEFQVLVAETDVRVGGRYHIVMKSPDGEEHDARGVYREVVANERLVFTWTWKTAPECESLVAFELTPAGDATELLFRHARCADNKARDRDEHCWTGCIRRLSRMCA